MADQDVAQRAGACIPNVDRPVLSAAEQRPSVGSKRERVDRASLMPCHGEGNGRRAGVVDVDASISGAYRDPLTGVGGNDVRAMASGQLDSSCGSWRGRPYAIAGLVR